MKIFILFSSFWSLCCYSQDTSKYQGFLNNSLLIESIELYSNGTFQWTSEYDLNWSESVKYGLTNDSLILSYNSKTSKKEMYLILESGLIKLDNKGRPIKK